MGFQVVVIFIDSGCSSSSNSEWDGLPGCCDFY